MRCPKCQYISFDSGGRCRNCGYDFSLSDAIETPDLPIQNGREPFGPLTELELQDTDAQINRSPSESSHGVAASETPDLREQPSIGARPITNSFDLPLFKDRPGRQDAAVVTPSVTPRVPLAVRRATVPVTKPRPRRDEAEEPRLSLYAGEKPVDKRAKSSPGQDAGVAAPVVARLGAALLDLAIVAGIDFIVLYFTLKICNLTFGEVSELPLAPIAGFLFLLNGGYFTTFVAAGGQTIGKMATGIRVIPGDPRASSTRVPFGHALVRAAAYVVSALPAGLGFVPGLIGPERRALHDRLADTRVVKA
jgi:uncharacterized RDD family membrane protein YckC